MAAGDLTVTNDLTVGGDAAVTGDLTVTGNVVGPTATGTTTVDDLAVGGAATVAETCDVTGAATVGGTLGVTGVATLTGGVDAGAGGTALKFKIITGVTVDGVATIAHGLTATKIMGVAVTVINEGASQDVTQWRVGTSDLIVTITTLHNGKLINAVVWYID